MWHIYIIICLVSCVDIFLSRWHLLLQISHTPSLWAVMFACRIWPDLADVCPLSKWEHNGIPWVPAPSAGGDMHGRHQNDNENGGLWGRGTYIQMQIVRCQASFRLVPNNVACEAEFAWQTHGCIDEDMETHAKCGGRPWLVSQSVWGFLSPPRYCLNWRNRHQLA